MRDAPIDGLIQKMLSARPEGSSGHCADENLMAAYLEASLSPKEAADFEAHVSKCDSCQEILALAMKLQSQSGERPLLQPASSKRTLFRFSIPIPVLGALAVALILTAVFFRFPRKPEKPDNQAIAELRRSVMGTQETELKATEPKSEESSVASAKSVRMDSALPREKSSVDVARSQMSRVPEKQQASAPADYRADLHAPQDAQLPSEIVPAVPSPTPADNLVLAFQGANENRSLPGGTASPATAAKGEVKEGILEAAGKDAAGTVPAAVPVGDLAQAMLTPPTATPVPGAAQTRQDSPLPTTVAGMAQSQQSEKAKNVAADEVASIRVQEAVTRPHVYAVQNRIAIAHYTSPSIAASVRLALKDLDSPTQKASETRKVGGKLFYKKSGYWIEKECVKHPDAAIVEITSEAPEHALILKDYPEIGTLAPALIYWKNRLYLLR